MGFFGETNVEAIEKYLCENKCCDTLTHKKKNNKYKWIKQFLQSIVIFIKVGKSREIFPEDWQLVNVEGMVELESIHVSIINEDENTDEGSWGNKVNTRYQSITPPVTDQHNRRTVPLPWRDLAVATLIKWSNVTSSQCDTWHFDFLGWCYAMYTAPVRVNWNLTGH